MPLSRCLPGRAWHDSVLGCVLGQMPAQAPGEGEKAMLDRRRSLGLGAAAAALTTGWRRGAAQEAKGQEATGQGATGQGATGQAAMGEVAQLVGSAQLLRGGTIRPLAQGEAVLTDDIVRTAADGRVQIRCRDGLRIAIGSGSEVALRSYLVEQDEGRLRAALGLLRGIVRLISGNALRRQWIEVDTRAAVASVRSTEWLVEVKETETAVLALEGVVEVRGLAGGLVRLQPGEGTDVVPGGVPHPAARWSSARRLDAIARTSF